MFANSAEVEPLIGSGKLRSLGVSSLRRLALLPNVPTLDEAGLKGYETVAWGGIVAPRGTPKDVVDKLNAAVQTALRSTAVRDGYARLGAEPASGSPEDFQKLIARETARWGQIIDKAGIEKLE